MMGMRLFLLIFVTHIHQTKNNMKKLIMMIAAAGMVCLSACDSKPAQKVQKGSTEIVDTAFQNKAAGEYRSYDSKRTLILTADGKVSSEGFKTDYTSWQLAAKPVGDMADIFLVRQGIEAPVKDKGTIDLKEGIVTTKDESFRKSNPKLDE
jgi:hypothetical protein